MIVRIACLHVTFTQTHMYIDSFATTVLELVSAHCNVECCAAQTTVVAWSSSIRVRQHGCSIAYWISAATFTSSSGRQETSQRVHVVHEGDAAKSNWWMHVEGIGSYQSNSWSQGELAIVFDFISWNIRTSLCHRWRFISICKLSTWLLIRFPDIW